MLNNDILNALKTYTANMKNKVSIVLQTGEYDKRTELIDFLTQLCSVSDNLNLVERDENLRSPITFYLEVDGENNGIHFSGIPSGHEFNSLVLAILQSSGTETKLDKTLATMVKKIQDDLHFEVFISLSCHNCPDVVQSLNQFAILNANISSEMIDGGLFQSLISERLNRECLHIQSPSNKPIKTVAWCTGGGQSYIDLAAENNIDAFITGEASEQTTHVVNEMDIHFFSAGHHATERYGVKALGEHIQSELGVEVVFIDIENPV